MEITPVCVEGEVGEKSGLRIEGSKIKDWLTLWRAVDARESRR